MTIQEYLQGRLSLEVAAQRLLSEFSAARGSFNFSITPRMRPLLAEVHRLQTGQLPPNFPPFAPDPKRHESGNNRLFPNTVESFWKTLRSASGPLKLNCSFHAATEEVARKLADWLRARGDTVTVQTPAEADADDWVVDGTTPPRRWAREALESWVESNRSAPLEGAGSLMGMSVLEAH